MFEKNLEKTLGKVNEGYPVFTPRKVEVGSVLSINPFYGDHVPGDSRYEMIREKYGSIGKLTVDQVSQDENNCKLASFVEIPETADYPVPVGYCLQHESINSQAVMVNLQETIILNPDIDELEMYDMGIYDEKAKFEVKKMTYHGMIDHQTGIEYPPILEVYNKEAGILYRLPADIFLRPKENVN